MKIIRVVKKIKLDICNKKIDPPCLLNVIMLLCVATYIPAVIKGVGILTDSHSLELVSNYGFITVSAFWVILWCYMAHLIASTIWDKTATGIKYLIRTWKATA